MIDEPTQTGLETIATESEASANATPSESEWNWTTPDGRFSDGWADHLPDELKSDVQALAKYQTLPDVLKSNVHLQKMLGKKSDAVSIPTDRSTPEEIAEYRKRMGVPEAPDKYQVLPHQLPEGMEIDRELLAPALAVAHKHHIPEAAMRELVAVQIANREQLMQREQEALRQSVEDNREVLRKEFKGDFDAKIRIATMAAKSVGVDVNSDGFGDPNVVRALVRLGEKLSDDKLIAGESVASMMPGKIKARDIQTNPSNPLYAKYQDGDPETVRYVRDMLSHG